MIEFKRFRRKLYDVYLINMKIWIALEKGLTWKNKYKMVTLPYPLCPLALVPAHAQWYGTAV